MKLYIFTPQIMFSKNKNNSHIPKTLAKKISNNIFIVTVPKHLNVLFL